MRIKRLFFQFLIAAFLSNGLLAGDVSANIAVATPSPDQVQKLLVPRSFSSEVAREQRIQLKEPQGLVYQLKKTSSQFELLDHETMLQMGDLIKTEEGSCVLVFEDKTQITIAPNTQLKIEESLTNRAKKNHSSVLRLKIGTLRAQVTKLAPGSRFEVVTPTAIASVRGTDFLLNTGQDPGTLQDFTILNVGETTFGVVLTNLLSEIATLIRENSNSTSFGNGSQLAPQPLTPQQWNQITTNFNNTIFQALQVLQQGGVEVIPTPPPGVLTNPLGSNPILPLGDPLNDALQDQISEQNISSDIVNDTVQDILDQNSGGSGNTLSQDQLEIRQVISDLLIQQEFAQLDANFEQQVDAQTGKVFTDLFGNRVRVEQYIFQPTSKQVQIMSLTHRSGVYQPGVSAAIFGIEFNTAITQPLQSLDWKNYLNTVTSEELSQRYLGGELPHDQFIVHENPSTDPSAFHPVSFWLQLSNPIDGRADTDKINFSEAYSAPFVGQFMNSAGQYLTYQVQGQESSAMVIDPVVGDTLRYEINSLQGSKTLFINGSEVPRGTWSVQDIGGPQTASGPAFADWYFDVGENFYGLFGLFYPITNDGGVVPTVGFELNGLRDLLSPNPLVNGGNYNLETIFIFSSSLGDNFVIDTIVTPEIFQIIPTENESQLFPATLNEDPFGEEILLT